MTLSKIEVLAIAGAIVGVVGIGGGLGGKAYSESQMQFSNPAVARVYDIRRIIETSPELAEEYTRLISQPDVREAVLRNERLETYSKNVAPIAMPAGALAFLLATPLISQYLRRMDQNNWTQLELPFDQ